MTKTITDYEISSPLCLNTSMNSGGDDELGFISHIPPSDVKQGEDRVRSFKWICVCCGSRPGFRSTFSRTALLLGNLMVEKQINLVYGGGSVVLMGLISEAVNPNCHFPLFLRVMTDTCYYWTRGFLGCWYRVIPRALLLPHELLGQTLGEVKIVADMHQRKSEMAKHADAFVALPSGYGTMEEMLEMITWTQLVIHDKPVGLLNVEDYYDSLLALLDKGVDKGFIQGSARRILVSADSPQELLSRMEEYEAGHERVATKQRWEVDQLSVSAAKSGDTQILVGPSS